MNIARMVGYLYDLLTDLSHSADFPHGTDRRIGQRAVLKIPAARLRATLDIGAEGLHLLTVIAQDEARFGKLGERDLEAIIRRVREELKEEYDREQVRYIHRS